VDFLKNHVEALIFCSTQPIKKKIFNPAWHEMFDAEVPIEDIEQAIAICSKSIHQMIFHLRLSMIGGGYSFYTKPAYQASIGIMLKQQSREDYQIPLWKHFLSSPTSSRLLNQR
jgi:segregation and condensation protein B